MFFVFDGLDGSGKSTQMRLLTEALEAEGRDVVTCRDPGTTGLGERLRTLVLDAESPPISAAAEALLYMASRAQLIEEVIAPALAAGRIVLCDRFTSASIAYQGCGRGLGAETIARLAALMLPPVEPDAVFLFDLPPTAALGRLTGPADRMEREDLAFFERVREGFVAQATARPDIVHLLPGNEAPEAIHGRVRSVLARWGL